LSAAKRVAARQERSAPLVAAFEAWMRAERAKLARLEAVNKQLGTRICVSAAAAERAQGFVGRPVGDLLLRGRTEPMRVFEPLSQDERASRHTLAYAAAFSKLEAYDPTALAAFATLVAERPADALAQYHLRRLLNGGTGTRIEMA
jgi:adenylate cyclase